MSEPQEFGTNLIINLTKRLIPTWGIKEMIWQVILIILAMVPLFLILLFLDEAALTNAYTALEVLEGYLAWSETIIAGFIIGMVLLILGNIAIIRSVKRKGISPKFHIFIMALSVVLMSFMLTDELISGKYGVLPFRQYARADIAAIESGDLPTTVYQIHLSWNNFYRSSSINDQAEYHSLYVVRIDPLGRVYFPRSLSLAYLQELAAGEEYQPPTAVAGMRHFQLTYTPNLQLVVEAVPITP